eukprot:TRINITY_DN98471_c0_g1_i1.p1 TRINITY_DN98471_c0_g1~~TRINITY_DN98471_c0_g1_i1.p1  ORF type:complete len:121 (+),score=7.64 TRINITY_DN98471_c0_g1_i1:128-490(+)
MRPRASRGIDSKEKEKSDGKGGDSPRDGRGKRKDALLASLIDGEDDLFTQKMILTGGTISVPSTPKATPSVSRSRKSFFSKRVTDGGESETDDSGDERSEKIGRAVQQECRDRSRMPSSA